MALPEHLKIEIMFKSNNRCCICQTPFIQIHHIDGNNENHSIENLAPLCPNCHSQTSARSYMTLELTPERIKKLRDKWYAYCEDRKMMFVHAISPNSIMKLKMFIREMPWPAYSWAKTFSSLHPGYQGLNREEIAERVFSTSNPDDIKTYLKAVFSMYEKYILQRDRIGLYYNERFKEICNAFGFDYDQEKKEILNNS